MAFEKVEYTFPDEKENKKPDIEIEKSSAIEVDISEKSKPEDKKIISDKKAELLERASKGPDGKARNFEEVPLTNEEIMKLSIPPLSKEQFEKLRNAADGKASVAGVGVLEKEQFEKEHEVKCPKCEGKGCPHCDGKGYHKSKKSRGRGFTR